MARSKRSISQAFLGSAWALVARDGDVPLKLKELVGGLEHWFSMG